MYIVGFNGPPESGKDTLAEMLADHMDKQGVTIPVIQCSLSTPLRCIAYGMAGWDGKRLEGDDYAEFKRTEFPLLGVTGRQLMIDASEKFLKPTYGEDVMARLFLSSHTGPYLVKEKVLLIRDSGFQVEVDPLIQAVGGDNLAIINVQREGKDFSNDSREWVFHPDPERRQYVVQNNGTLDDLRTEAGRIYGRLVNQCGWKL